MAGDLRRRPAERRVHAPRRLRDDQQDRLLSRAGPVRFSAGQGTLPLLASLRNGADAPYKFWSAAASIGAEAYTIAMVAAEALGLDARRFSVLGTDISTEVIAQAQRAVYPRR